MAADVTFIYSNLAVGGGIYTPANMKEISEMGITHIVDCQAEWDDTPAASPFGIKVLWCPTFDNFQAPAERELEAAANFITESLIKKPHASKMLIHCAGGVHRGPMFTLLAVMMCGVSSWDAVKRIQHFRDIANFPNVYRSAVERFLEKQSKRAKLSGGK